MQNLQKLLNSAAQIITSKSKGTAYYVRSLLEHIDLKRDLWINRHDEGISEGDGQYNSKDRSSILFLR